MHQLCPLASHISITLKVGWLLTALVPLLFHNIDLAPSTRLKLLEGRKSIPNTSACHRT